MNKNNRNFESLDAAYVALANAAEKFPAGRKWDEVRAQYKLWAGMTSYRCLLVSEGEVDEKGDLPPEEICDFSMRAAEYLRDNLLQTTGHRIYGLTFTLFPDGKCKIEYDYNPPEGYEETDETFTLGEAIDRLEEMGVKVEVPDKKESAN